MSTLQRVRVYLARVGVNVVVLACWAGAGYLIYMVVTEWSQQVRGTLVIVFSSFINIFYLNMFVNPDNVGAVWEPFFLVLIHVHD